MKIPKKLTILVDMDDTIEHLLEAWVKWLNETYNLDIACSDVREWDIGKAFPMLDRSSVYEPLINDEFWKTVMPMDGAAEALQMLMAAGHSVYIVTASAYQTMQSKMENVLFKYFPFISWNDVIVTSNKQMIRGDVLVDDAPHNLLGGEYAKILMSCHHNMSYDAEANGMVRVSDWYGVLAEVNRLANEY